ncbi:helix-turn-helix domain-containing protein [Bradyrhizobium sp.]|uniref:helix-turn-helix domain-containing protein n=1 Tax=Bradyrhizobium sp. TaxID=376 RepID=UPI001E09224F|nr:AraC family transcriptional regulator [Bradyrhizobium sp.]MBV8700306.1 helix-turn-helix transcriptional regulator [Bradyrhizobium sp.]MBV8920109.1 helix-turn-helix transcriptional regulator [Bradyrhizobium sp.]MBV9979491.1 helix-turn-helix transcriptional regulator [Bradyrhizobium sp.]
MLASYRVIQSCVADEIEAACIEHCRSNRVDITDAAATAEFVTNVARFEHGLLSFCRYHAPIVAGFNEADCTRLNYHMREGSAVCLEGETSEIISCRTGCLIPAGRRWRARHRRKLEDLAVHIPTTVLQRKYAAYLGHDRQVLDVVQPSAVDPDGAVQLRRVIFGFAKAVENAEKPFLPNLVVASLDDISLRMLACFSQEVQTAASKPAAPSQVQIGRVEQYLVAHYAEALTIETLARISGVSGRSVISYFQMKHGCTPQQYLDRVRVQMAHLELRVFSGNSVESVALQCGFPSLGAFEQSYRQQFGIAPGARYTVH